MSAPLARAPEGRPQRPTVAVMLNTRQLDALARQLAADLAERLDETLAQRIASAVVRHLSERSHGGGDL